MRSGKPKLRCLNAIIDIDMEDKTEVANHKMKIKTDDRTPIVLILNFYIGLLTHL